MRVHVEHKHPLSLRWNHWINFPLLLIMMWSGAMIYWAYPAYGIPGSWLAALGFERRLGEGLAWHLVFAALFTLNGLAYVIFLGVTGHWRYIVPKISDFRGALLTAAHDLRLSKRPLLPQVKYNPAQKITYSFILILGVVMTATGYAMYKPVQLGWLLAIFGGYQWARTIHFVVTGILILFFVVHLLQVVRAGFAAFWAMISGWEKQRAE